VDQIQVFHAGLLLGDKGTPSLATLPRNKLQDFPRFTLKSAGNLGRDSLSIWE
jgi:riboflavin biosynthesis pyrimidine reductase